MVYSVAVYVENSAGRDGKAIQKCFYLSQVLDFSKSLCIIKEGAIKSFVLSILHKVICLYHHPDT